MCLHNPYLLCYLYTIINILFMHIFPLQKPTCARARARGNAHEERANFQPQPLAEMEVGACRRGRPRGRRNKTVAQKISELAQRRDLKKVREKQRVKNLNRLLLSLREMLGLSELKSDSKECKGYCKLRTLRAATERIRTLKAILNLTSDEVRCPIESPQRHNREIDERSVEHRKTSPQAVVVKKYTSYNIMYKKIVLKQNISYKRYKEKIIIIFYFLLLLSFNIIISLLSPLFQFLSPVAKHPV